MKCDIVIPVWGKLYSDLLTSVFLPTLLADGNLPDWPYAEKTKLVIYAPPTEQKRISTSPTIKLIKHWITIDWRDLTIKPAQQQKKYAILKNIHEHALQVATSENRSLILASPDMLLSQQSLSIMAEKIAQGQHLILCMGWQLHLDQTLPKIMAITQNHQLHLSSQQIMEWIHTSLHGINQICFWKQLNSKLLPQVHYDNEKHHITSHCFHLHPIFIRYPNLTLDMHLEDTVDADSGYLSKLCVEPEKVTMLNHPDFICATLKESENQSINPTQAAATKQELLDHFYHHYTHSIQRWFFKHPIQLGTHSQHNNPPPDFKVLNIIWDIEQYFKQQNYPQVVHLFQQNQFLFSNEIHYSGLFSVFYQIAFSYIHLQRLDSLKRFIQQHRLAFLRYRPNQNHYEINLISLDINQKYLKTLAPHPFPSLDKVEYQLHFGVIPSQSDRKTKILCLTENNVRYQQENMIYFPIQRLTSGELNLCFARANRVVSHWRFKDNMMPQILHCLLYGIPLEMNGIQIA